MRDNERRMRSYWVYIVKCSDDSYYTGCTSQLERRIHEHNQGIFSGYTNSRRPVKLVFSQEFNEVEDAIRAERKIKNWSRKKKIALINNDFELLHKLSECKNRSHSRFYDR